MSRTPPSHRTRQGHQLVFPTIQIAAVGRILDLMEIDEINSVLSILFSLELSWRDQNLEYSYLKSTAAKNEISDAVAARIWLPSIQFLLTERKGDIYEVGRNLFVEREGEARLRGDPDVRLQGEAYAGAENILHLKITNRIKFFCSFENIENYPFGSQNCSFQIFITGADNNLTKLESKDFKDLGPTFVGEFLICCSCIYSVLRKIFFSRKIFCSQA